MSHGIEKEVDKLGRIVLPVKFRAQLGIKTEEKVLVSLAARESNTQGLRGYLFRNTSPNFS